MRTNRFSNRFARRSLATLAALAGLALAASPAVAIYPDEPIDPVDGPVPGPDLRLTSLSIGAASSTEWQIGYTVQNTGNADAAGSKVAFRNNGSALLAERAVPVLAAGASRSESFRIPRSGCYLPVLGEADSARSVAELNDANNTRWGVGQSLPCSSLPRYRVKAVSFKAEDESNADWTGSDEAYWIFNTVSNSGTAASQASRMFGDVDTGESRSFASTEGCIYAACGSSAQAPYGIGFSIQLWEQDLGHVSETLYDTAEAFQTAGPILSAAGAPSWIGTTIGIMGEAMEVILGWAEDDLIGNVTYAYTPEYLASRLTTAGASFTDTRRFEGASTSGGANYTMTLQVVRVA